MREKIGYDKRRISNDDMIRDFKNTHSDRYDYSVVVIRSGV